MSHLARLARPLLSVQRGWIQAGATLLTNSYFPTWFKHVPCPGLNCYSCPGAVFACPIGALQHFAADHRVPLYLGGVLGLVGLMTGRLSCGWLCPFGFVQDLVHRLPVRKWSPPLQLPWLRFAVLGTLVFALPFFTAELWFSKLCPMGTLEAGIPWVLISSAVRNQAGSLFVLKVGILLLFLGWMAVTRRPFCRYVCPLGAIYALFNRFSLFRITSEPAACTDCKRCRAVCPVEIDPVSQVNSMSCIHCLDCVRTCPTGALRLEA